jgi:hypothetical protein
MMKKNPVIAPRRATGIAPKTTALSEAAGNGAANQYE